MTYEEWKTTLTDKIDVVQESFTDLFKHIKLIQDIECDEAEAAAFMYIKLHKLEKEIEKLK